MTDWRDSPTVRAVRAWERPTTEEWRIMTLDEFVSLNYEAAILLYKTGRMGLLTDDPYYLSGEATDAEAMVLLLQRQLNRKNDEDLAPTTRNRRAVLEGTRPKHVRQGQYKGVYWHPRGWVPRVQVGNRKVNLGYFADPREGALVWDKYVTEHCPGRVTNHDLGLLGEE